MAGRPSKYETNVKPKLEEIRKLARSGATDKEIARHLDVNQKVFCRYKKEYSELSDILKTARDGAVEEIKAALFNRAIGMSYTEKKIIRKQIVLDGEDDEKIPATLVQTEEYQKYALPDPTSAMMLLKHWAKDEGWTSDPQTLELKKQELELKKEHMESEDW